MSNNNPKNQTIQCKLCGQLITTNLYKGRKYCSKECSKESQKRRAAVTCENCGKSFIKKLSEIKRTAKNFCSRSCSDS